MFFYTIVNYAFDHVMMISKAVLPEPTKVSELVRQISLLRKLITFLIFARSTFQTQI